MSTLVADPVKLSEGDRLTAATFAANDDVVLIDVSTGKNALIAKDEFKAATAPAVADVTGLQAALDAKAAASHTHAVADVTGLQAALDGKAAAVHSHAIADVTGLQTALDAKAAAADLATLETEVDGKASTGSVAALSTALTEAEDDIAALQTAVDGKAAAVHTHAIADVTGLQAALDAKATPADVTAAVAAVVDAAPTSLDTLKELADALNDDADFAATVTAELAGKASTSHTHAVADVTGLQAALDGKAAAADALLRTLADAKGDLLVGTAADTVARLAVGTNGQVLTADSSAAGGVKWADAAGGSAIDWDSAAVLRSDGSDTTGTVGDPSKPYATAQAAYDDGARTFLVCEKPAEATYGGVTITANAKIHVVALDGVARLGTITGGGYALTIYGSGRERVILGGVNNQPTADGAGPQMMALYSLTVAGNVIQSGKERTGSSGAGGQGGTLYTRDVRIEGTTELYGASGGPGDSPGGTGGTGGAGGTLDAADSVFVGDVYAGGGGGGTGGAGDTEIGGGTGGKGSTGGIMTAKRCEFQGAATVVGGVGGGGGAEGGAGAGSDGDGEAAGSFTAEFCKLVSVDATGGNGFTPAAGGSVALDHCEASSTVATPAGDLTPSGSTTANFTSLASANSATRSGSFVVEGGTTYQDWN